MSKIHKPYECCAVEKKYFIRQVLTNVNTVCAPVHVSGENADDKTRQLAEEEARLLLEKAHKEAAQIVETARKNAEQLIERTTQSAYAEGFAQGEKQGFQQAENAILQAEGVLEDMLQEKYRLFEDLEPQILDLSVKIAEKIIGEQINLDRSRFLALISRAIKKAAGAERVSVFIHPKQYDYAEEFRQALLSEAGSVKTIDFFRNELLDELGCLIETDCGVIDAGCLSQINKLEQTFKLQESYG